MLSRLAGKDPVTGKKVKGVNESSKMTAFKKVIDGNIFVFPRRIPLIFDGEMTICQRSLRAQTPQGERVALSASEEVPAGATDGLSLGFGDYPNLTILDETTVLGNVWDNAEDDTVTGLFFRILRDGAREADPDTARTLELAARIGRKILEGREVELP